MSDLLPIIFSRGQNEGIDPRVAPPDVHRIAQNVRWRKDGRPAKRFGLTALTTAGLNAGFGYLAQAVNAVGSWNNTPVLALGSSVRTLAEGGTWSSAAGPAGELSHWGPGERDVLARDERTQLQNVTSGICGGYVVHAWDDGAQTYYTLRRAADGSTIRGPRQLLAGTAPRIVSATNYLYILNKDAAGVINLLVFDPATASISGLASPGTLATVACNFDACGRGADWVLVYQSAVNAVTVKLLTAVAAPVVTQTQGAFVAAGVGAQVGIVSDATNSVFVLALDAAFNVNCFVWNNALTVNTGLAVLEVDANDAGQPGLALVGAGSCFVVWGGYVAASETGYLRTATVNTASAITTSIGTYYGVNPASKPFMGPNYSTFPGDGPYVWAHTHNSLVEVGGNTKWDTQRTYYLLRLPPIPIGGGALQRQLHTPNVVASYPATGSHLSDVISLGAGNGHLVPLPNAIRFGNGLAVAYGMDSVTFHSIFESPRYAARDTVAAGRALQFTGGALFELNGLPEETGFSSFPVIESIVGGAGGAMTIGGTYNYRAVYEHIDLQGRRHRSAPSDPFAYVAGGANTAAVVTVKPLIADSHFAGGVLLSGIVALHIYRTLAGQGTYHRVTPNFGSPIASSPPSGFAIAYVDRMSDAVLGAQEFIYTDGGVADNTLAPPSTFACVCNGRVWLGGQLDRCVITASKLLVDGEPTQFSDLDAFSVFLPEKCTGLASLDGTVVAFARERIYLIQGDGPNDQGVGQFSPPVALPTDVGCIDWRSVAETSIGIFFQSKRGIYLLPRGFNTPLFIGAEIEDTLSVYPVVSSATVVSAPSTGSNKLGEITVRFVLGASDSTPGLVVATYDLRTSGWSIDLIGSAALGACGTWSDTFVMPQVNLATGALVNLFAESSAGYSDNGQFIATTLGTGDVRPFGAAGYGQFNSVVVMGEYRGNAQVQVQVSVDGVAADTFAFSVTAPDAPDGVVYLDCTPRVQKGASIRVTVSDAPDAGTGSAATEGFLMQALFLETELIGKAKRLPGARRA